LATTFFSRYLITASIIVTILTQKIYFVKFVILKIRDTSPLSNSCHPYWDWRRT
jgi:hypothetical protein